MGPDVGVQCVVHSGAAVLWQVRGSLEMSLRVCGNVLARVAEYDKVAPCESAVAHSFVSDTESYCCSIERACKVAMTVERGEDVSCCIVGVVVFDLSLDGQGGA